MRHEPQSEQRLNEAPTTGGVLNMTMILSLIITSGVSLIVTKMLGLNREITYGTRNWLYAAAYTCISKR